MYIQSGWYNKTVGKNSISKTYSISEFELHLIFVNFHLSPSLKYKRWFSNASSLLMDSRAFLFMNMTGSREQPSVQQQNMEPKTSHLKLLANSLLKMLLICLIVSLNSSGANLAFNWVGNCSQNLFDTPNIVILPAPLITTGSLMSIMLLNVSIADIEALKFVAAAVASIGLIEFMDRFDDEEAISLTASKVLSRLLFIMFEVVVDVIESRLAWVCCKWKTRLVDGLRLSVALSLPLMFVMARANTPLLIEKCDLFEKVDEWRDSLEADTGLVSSYFCTILIDTSSGTTTFKSKLMSGLLVAFKSVPAIKQLWSFSVMFNWDAYYISLCWS